MSGAQVSTLSHQSDRLSADAKASLAAALQCACVCGGTSATLRNRIISGNHTVHLQCDNCGKSRGTFKRDGHPFFQEYAKWDEGIRDRYDWKSNATSQSAYAERVRQTSDAWTLKRREYAQFCRENPEWRALRNTVVERAGGVCEACLKQRAVTAHHLTYNSGPLPPAWLLRAVCEGCHRRLHASKFGGSDEWEPYAYAASLVSEPR